MTITIHNSKPRGNSSDNKAVKMSPERFNIRGNAVFNFPGVVMHTFGCNGFALPSQWMEFVKTNRSSN